MTEDFSSFTGLGAGESVGGLSVTFNTSTLGTFTGTITLLATGYNASGYSGQLPDIELILNGDIVAQQTVPEPAAMVLFGSGLVGLAGL
ncbi:MAG: PEP-CTERM sorting domain-containing protein, partial [Desulfocapsaceae bacterium]|nr:PEP-CTERM sorting domain-containing protein [Desulfocapsaceae bacterium]